MEKLQLYNRPLLKNELLQNAESEGLKTLKAGVVVQDGLVLHYDFRDPELLAILASSEWTEQVDTPETT